MRRMFAGLIGAALAAAAAASAQEVIPTAAGAGAPPVQTSGIDPTWITHEADAHDDRGPAPIGPCGAPYKPDAAGALKQDKDPHGAVWAGVGTRGYREAGGAVCVPIGQTGEVSVAVDATRWGRR